MAIEPGLRLGPYVLEESIGRGSMGTVYRARHEPTQRTAVVKFLQPLANDPEAKARFRAEMQALSRLRHPNVLALYDSGEYEGVPYMVVEYAPGGSLADRISGGRRLERRAALALLRGVAAALDQAHLVGILHGDVNPANVLLGYDDTPLLADFGLARLLQPAPSPGTTAVPSGNPAYMAPERVTGGAVGPASDNYAFAALTYELLTGHVPFEGVGGLEQLYAHVHNEPPPPSRYDPTLPRGVDAVLLSGLAKDPARRWPTCGELLDALEAALGGAVVEGAEPVEAVVEERRSRLPLWIALGIAAVVLLGLIGFLISRALNPGPSISLSSNNVKAGDNVVVKGQNLPARQLGTIMIESTPQQLGNFQADSKGSFETVVTVPADVSGTHLIEACWNGSCPAKQTVNVAPSPSPSPSPSATPTQAPTPPPTAPPTATPVFTPSIRIDSTSGLNLQPNQQVTVNGSGFDPRRQYVITLRHDNGSQWQLQPPSSPQSNGSYSTTVRIPPDAPPGGAFIVACITPGDQCVQQQVSIRSAASPSR